MARISLFFAIKIQTRAMTETEILWKKLNWLEIGGEIYLLQRGIYEASKIGDQSEIHRLQNIIIESPNAKFLAVKRVTQDNKGKNTPGIDGEKSLNPEKRYLLASNLILDGKARPVRRVYIAKPGTNEMRSLGIPTIVDRAKQALAKLALEPQWEARFESHSFGFRPGRKAADATWQIRHKLKYSALWVYDADIKKCFDKISHSALLNKIGSLAKIQNQIRSWLEAGIFEKGEAFPSGGIGTPQGGVISPLLANCALDGAQRKIWDSVYSATGNKKKADKVLYIRYADDFVILSPEKEWLDVAIRAVEAHIAEMGLEIKSEKTRTLHTLKTKGEKEDESSFNFLGFNFSQRKLSRYKTVKLGGGKGSIDLVPIVVPMKSKVKSHFSSVSQVFSKSRSSLDLIRECNPLLRGWRNYYKFSDSRTYGRLPGLLDSRLNVKCRHWIKRNFNRYGKSPLFWTSKGGDNWIFYSNDPISNKAVHMDKYSAVSWSLQAYNRIDSSRSPYDGDIKYWSLHGGGRTMGVTSPKR